MNEPQQPITKLEFLPNEILIDCFDYLNIFEIFYSFNYLNNHFNQLIHVIPLYLNFKSISKSLFDKFCQLILLNPEIKNQIYSLELSNKDTAGQIDIFLSFFSLADFSRLQSLTLVQVLNENIKPLQSMLPLIPQLSSFYLLDSDTITLDYSFSSNLEILTIPKLLSIKTSLSSITNLTISYCSFNQLINLLIKYTEVLKCLKIHSIFNDDNSKIKDSNVKAVHLKELIIEKFNCKFKDFQRLIKHIPQLTTLQLCSTCDIDMIDGKQWEDLIKSSLPYLNSFKFIFNYTYKNKNDNILEKLNQFQNDFWLKQHQWYTEYSISDYSASIYTTPYMLNSYTLEMPRKRYWNQIFNTFDNVKNLTLYHATLKESCEYYFANVNSLTILPSDQFYQPLFEEQDIKSLKAIVNLSNLQHIGFSEKFRFQYSSVLSTILRESPKISSMNINVRVLDGCCLDYALCDCLKLIKKLNLYKYGSFLYKNRQDLDSFFNKFPNLEQLICNIDKPNDLLFIIKYLPKLIFLKAYLWLMYDKEYFRSWFINETQRFNLSFYTKYTGGNETELSVWIDRNKKKF